MKGKPSTSLSRSAEERFLGDHFHTIIGIDEAGRGPLAGPVVAAACIIENGVTIAGIIDSKQITEEDREITYELIVNHPSVKWGVSIVDHKEIDEVNILQATMNAMRRAMEQLLSKHSTGKDKVTPSDCIALIDGNRCPQDMPVESQFVIKGDGSIFSIAAASIIAKVTRDRIMVELHRQYPQFNLAQHKGYPTFAHRSALHEHGPSDIHRLTFGPVKSAFEKHGGITIVSNLAASSGATTATAANKGKKGKVTKESVEAALKSVAVEVKALKTRGKKIMKFADASSVSAASTASATTTKRGALVKKTGAVKTVAVEAVQSTKNRKRKVDAALVDSAEPITATTTKGMRSKIRSTPLAVVKARAGTRTKRASGVVVEAVDKKKRVEVVAAVRRSVRNRGVNTGSV